MKYFKTTYIILRNGIKEFMKDKVLKESAALAFYTVFSLPAALIVMISTTGIIYGKDAVSGELYFQIQEFVGPNVAMQIQEILKNIHLEYDNIWMGIFGIGVLIFSATGIFTEIQDSINHIWGLKVKPEKGWFFYLKNRLISFSMVLALGFTLLVSLIINAALEVFTDWLKQWFPISLISLFHIIDQVIIFSVITFLFASIIKVLPDAQIKWRNVMMGSVVSALLFLGGKWLVGYYLTHSAIISAYGAASSVIILLFWVFYSAVVLFFGAEITQVYVRYKGERIHPNNYAVWIQEREIEVESNV